MQLKKLYVLVTPAHNEEKSIEKTIQSVISQNIRPEKWVIVNDGSTDKTKDIIEKYTKKYSWIKTVNLPIHRDRQFSAKVYSFMAGYESIRDLNYDIIGNLDADISFEEDYFQYLLKKFSEFPDLGVAGTPFIEDTIKPYDYNYTNIEHVSGACQIFRRECFEEIGGYTPIKGGGIDWVAVTTARMKGWKTRTFTDKVCYHHRGIGTGNTNRLKAIFNHGKKDYYLGGHPLWQVFRSIYQLRNKPYFIGGLLFLIGYLWAALKKMERPISDELVQFNRTEQLQRLKKIFQKIF